MEAHGGIKKQSFRMEPDLHIETEKDDITFFEDERASLSSFPSIQKNLFPGQSQGKLPVYIHR